MPDTREEIIDVDQAAEAFKAIDWAKKPTRITVKIIDAPIDLGALTDHAGTTLFQHVQDAVYNINLLHTALEDLKTATSVNDFRDKMNIVNSHFSNVGLKFYDIRETVQI